MSSTSFSTPDISASLMRVQANRQQQTLPSAEHVSDADKAKLRERAKEFESFFIYQSMELMKPAIDSEFSGGYAEDMFRHTLNEQMADNVTQSGGFGIADTIYKELLKNQETHNATLAAAKAASNAYSAAAK